MESPIQSKASSALRKSSKYCSACSQGLMENASSCYSFFRRGGHWDLTPLLIVHSSLNPNLWRKLVCLILTGFTPPLKEFYSSNVQLDIRSHRLPGGVFPSRGVNFFLESSFSPLKRVFFDEHEVSSSRRRFPSVNWYNYFSKGVPLVSVRGFPSFEGMGQLLFRRKGTRLFGCRSYLQVEIFPVSGEKSPLAEVRSPQAPYNRKVEKSRWCLD